MLAALKQLLWKAAWAPASVVILHAIVAETHFRQTLDFAVHYLGGASIAFFLFHALRCFEAWLGTVTPPARYLFTFALACTVGLFWEFAELSSDTFLHTHIQKSVHETMSDLVADATGAITALLSIFTISRFIYDRHRPIAKADESPFTPDA